MRLATRNSGMGSNRDQSSADIRVLERLQLACRMRHGVVVIDALGSPSLGPELIPSIRRITVDTQAWHGCAAALEEGFALLTLEMFDVNIFFYKH